MKSTMKSVYAITCASYEVNIIGVCTNLKEVRSLLSCYMESPPAYLQLVTDFKERKTIPITRKDYTHTLGQVYKVTYLKLNTPT